MGKRLIQQARGKGGPRYRSPGHNFVGAARNKKGFGTAQGRIIDLVNCPGHSAPLARIKYEDGEECLMIAAEGMKVGDEVSVGGEMLNRGNLMSLKDVPEGTLIYNIEIQPGDGGKFVRSSGTFAKVIAKSTQGITVKLPSKKDKVFYPDCRASIGVVAGGGRVEKPWLKAGKKYHAMKAKNKLWPKVSGGSMNAVDHPFGGSRTSHLGRPTIAPRNAPPGRKVGKLRPRRTGRRKR